MAETVNVNARACRIPFVRTGLTKLQKLAEAERRIFSALGIEYFARFVKIPYKDSEIHTITAKCNTPLPAIKNPIVLVHGFGAGVALWGMVIKKLAQFQTVHAFDLLGFGSSSRPKFSTDPETAEQELVDSIELWRNEMNIEKMNLIGHSFGGYLATSYALRYPERVDKLVLADPWGYNDFDPDRFVNLSTTKKALFSVLLKFNPLAVLRLVGSYGPSLMRKMRPDLQGKYSDDVYDYVYLANSRTPTGETAFKTLTQNLVWAKQPMSKRFHELDTTVPVTFIHGQMSWIDRQVTSKFALDLNHVDLHIMENAGHHVYADDTERFVEIVAEALTKENTPVNNDSGSDLNASGSELNVKM